jgi:hypothetical protein
MQQHESDDAGQDDHCASQTGVPRSSRATDIAFTVHAPFVAGKLARECKSRTYIRRARRLVDLSRQARVAPALEETVRCGRHSRL